MKQDIQSLINAYKLRAECQEQIISNQAQQINSLERSVSLLTEQNKSLKDTLDSMSAALSATQDLCDRQQELLDAYAALDND